MVFKRLILTFTLLISGTVWAVLLDRVISEGPVYLSGYSGRPYDISKLCDLVKPGMEMRQVTSLVHSLGKPNDLAYLKTGSEKLELFKKSLRAKGERTDNLVASDVAEEHNLQNSLIYPNNVLVVQSVIGTCDIQMDSAGRKVVGVSKSLGRSVE